MNEDRREVPEGSGAGEIALVCSSGGHLRELYALRSAWEGREHFWVTFPTADAVGLLSGETSLWAFYPTNRNLLNLFRNTLLALRILRRRRPSLVISTGAGVGVPFLLVAKILGIPTLFIESLTRVKNLSLTGRLVYPWVDRFLVQWEELAALYPKTLFRGRVL